MVLPRCLKKEMPAAFFLFSIPQHAWRSKIHLLSLIQSAGTERHERNPLGSFSVKVTKFSNKATNTTPLRPQLLTDEARRRRGSVSVRRAWQVCVHINCAWHNEGFHCAASAAARWVDTLNYRPPQAAVAALVCVGTLGGEKEGSATWKLQCLCITIIKGRETWRKPLLW